MFKSRFAPRSPALASRLYQESSFYFRILGASLNVARSTYSSSSCRNTAKPDDRFDTSDEYFSDEYFSDASTAGRSGRSATRKARSAKLGRAERHIGTPPIRQARKGQPRTDKIFTHSLPTEGTYRVSAERALSLWKKAKESPPPFDLKPRAARPCRRTIRRR